jgi:aspartate carbamoyltransferase regulatory subunit
VITVALNVPSNKYEKKDIIKVENRYLKPDETNKLSLIAPHATINIIKEYKLAEKRKILSPDYITGIFKCPNLRCVTNGENIKSVIEIMDKDKMILRCKYCGRILSIDELII